MKILCNIAEDTGNEARDQASGKSSAPAVLSGDYEPCSRVVCSFQYFLRCFNQYASNCNKQN